MTIDLATGLSCVRRWSRVASRAETAAGPNAKSASAHGQDIPRNLAEIIVELMIPLLQRPDQGMWNSFRIEMNMGRGHLGVIGAMIEIDENA